MGEITLNDGMLSEFFFFTPEALAGLFPGEVLYALKTLRLSSRSYFSFSHDGITFHN